MDIAAWLRSLGLERYEPAFRDHAIDAEILPELTDEHLKELDLPLGHRLKLLKAIAALRTEAPSAGSPVTPSAEARRNAHTATAAPEAERRQLTVMFVDLVASTALSGRLDPEDMGAMIRAYQDACAGVITRFEGHVAKYMGDGVLAYFGYPRAHEDAAERAVRAGLGVVGAVGRLAAPDDGTPLATRVGIATGLVMVGELIGEGAAKEEAVVGETPNLAARLQALAEPDSVVIGPTTRRLVGGLFELADLGAHDLKGFAAPVRAWRVLGPSAAESRFEARLTAGLTPLVGRDEELALLLRRWELAREGEGQVVLLSGEPGIGKSRLVRALRERLAGEPHIALRYQCSPYHTGTALFPVIDQLERAAGFTRDDTAESRLAKLEALLAEGTADVARVLPLVADLLAIPSAGRYPTFDLTPQRRKELTFEALLGQLAGLAARGPVLVVLEDAHWLDPTTQELFGLVVDRARNLPVLVVVTFRPEFVPPWTGRPHAAAFALSRLGRRQAAAMVDRVAGSRALTPEVLDQIAARTDGVPLFVEELTKAVLESGLLHEEGGRYTVTGPVPPLAIPTTLQDSLMARLDRLAPVKEVAQLGAVIGREFPYELLAAVAPVRGSELDHALEELIGAELIFPHGVPPDVAYTFKHALVRDAAYQSLLRSRRQQLHARLARVLEERFARVVETQPEVLARHCAEAGLIEKAAAYWHKAGELAVARSAMKEAVAQLTAGLEALDILPEGVDRDRRELELQVTLGVALLPARGQAAPETGRAYSRARELADRLGETQRLLRSLYGLCAHHTARADLRAAGEVAGTLLRIAEEQDDPVGTAAGRRMLGVTCLAAGEFTAARTHLERTLAASSSPEHARSHLLYAMDPWVAASAWLAWPLLLTGYPDRAHVRHGESLVRARKLGHPNTLAQVLYCGCAYRQLHDDPDGVRELARILSSLATEQAFPYWLAMATMFDGWVLAREGEAERAVERLQAGLDAYRAIRAELWQPYFLALSAEAHEGVGRTSEARRLLDEALERVARSGERWFEAELFRLKGEALLRPGSGDTTAAEVWLRKAADVAQAQGAKWWELRAAVSLASLWAARGERRRAHDLLAPVYGWFAEGFDTPDLKAAKALLDELG